MKRRWTLYIALIIALLALTACTPPQLTEADFEALEKKSLELTNDMLAGNYKTIVSLYSDNAKKANIGEAELSAIWGGEVQSLGAHESVNISERKGTPDGCIVQIRVDYPGESVMVTWAYNAYKQLDGLFFNKLARSTAPTSNERYEELPIRLGTENPLDGLLTIPKSDSPVPVVILIHGSGPVDMDATVGKAGNKIFRDIAQHLAEHGIATLRYNKRTIQYPLSIDPATVTIEQETIADVHLAIDLALSDPRLDGDRIFLAGHSLGGMVVPAIAASRPEVDGIIALAGSPRHLAEIVRDQNREAIESLTDKTPAEREQLIEQVENFTMQVLSLTPQDPEKGLFGIPNSYWLSLTALEVPDKVKRLTIPMLFLQGEADFQVYRDKDYMQWIALVGEHKNASFQLFPGLNHHFMITSGVRNITDYDRPGHVEPKVIQAIIDWVNAR